MPKPLTALFDPAAAHDWASAILNGCSQIFLQRQPLCGLLCLLAIAWGAPALLGGALLGAGAGWLTAERRRFSLHERNAGLYGYNGALLGLLLSSQFAWSTLQPLLIICSAGLSSLLLQRWLAYNRRHLGLPPYTAPFVLLGWLLLALGDRLQLLPTAAPSASYIGPLAIQLPQAVLRGLSQVVFIDSPLSGLGIFIALWLANRRSALWALAGSTLSLLLGLQLGQTEAALAGLYGLNGALVGIALSQRYQQPWPVLAAIALSALLQLGFAGGGLSSPLTAPFILACWLLQAASLVLQRCRAQQ